MDQASFLEDSRKSLCADGMGLMLPPPHPSLPSPAAPRAEQWFIFFLGFGYTSSHDLSSLHRNSGN